MSKILILAEPLSSTSNANFVLDNQKRFSGEALKFFVWTLVLLFLTV